MIRFSQIYTKIEEMLHQLNHEEIRIKEKEFEIILVLCNIEKTQNVGMILRSAVISGVAEVYTMGENNYPTHKLKKISRNAENFLSLKKNSIECLEEKFPREKFTWAALEYTDESLAIENFKALKNILLFVGNEKRGIPEEILNKTDVHLHLEMYGNISSYNVAVATSIALYQLRL